MRHSGETKMTNRWEKGRYARQRWSKNAIAKKARLKAERLSSPQAEHQPPPEVFKVKPAKFSVKINIERTDGERIQFTCHRIGDKIYRNGSLVAPKSFFRRIGEIAELWSRP
jgi:hypothetical protein